MQPVMLSFFVMLSLSKHTGAKSIELQESYKIVEFGITYRKIIVLEKQVIYMLEHQLKYLEEAQALY